MSDETPKPRLTVKEQKFVQTLVSGNSETAQKAVVDAGYAVTTTKSASVMANQMLRKAKIQNALAAAIEKKFPDVPGLGAEVLYNMLRDENESSMVKLKALEYLMKLFGWQAPTKHATMRVNLNDRLALPGDEDADS